MRTAADLIQLLMKDENIDKDILIVQRRPLHAGSSWRPEEIDIEYVDDIGGILKLMVDLPECEEAHCEDRDDCECNCDLCSHCLKQ